MRQKWAVLFLNGQPSTDEREKANIYGISTCGLVVEKTDFQAHTHTQKKGDYLKNVTSPRPRHFGVVRGRWRHCPRSLSSPSYFQCVINHGRPSWLCVLWSFWAPSTTADAHLQMPSTLMNSDPANKRNRLVVHNNSGGTTYTETKMLLLL